MLTARPTTVHAPGGTRAPAEKPSAAAVLFSAVALCLCSACSSLTYDVRITNEDINNRLAVKFPVTKTYLLITATFSNPQVVLHDGTDRVTLGIDVAVELPARRRKEVFSGSVTVTSGIRFNNATGQFFLEDPVIDSLSLSEPGGSRAPQIQALLGAALHEYLGRMPVYTLKPTDVKKSIAKMVIKEVRISDGAIIVTLGG